MRGRKVLVVDDSWSQLTLIATPLRESGYDVIIANDGEEAYEKVLTERPDCVVLDVVLPRQNGFQLCRRLKRTEQSRDIPVILISSKGTPVDIQWGMQQGADAYITKPFRPEDLLANVARVM
jgi:DNA-binding response OmpR family regulator